MMNRVGAAFADTGTTTKQARLSGHVEMFRWDAVSDTGASLEISISPSNADTGRGYVIWTDTGKLGGDYMVAPRKVHNITTSELVPSDTGRFGAARYVAAGDTVNMKVTAKGTTAVTGTLWVYTDE